MVLIQGQEEFTTTLSSLSLVGNKKKRENRRSSLVHCSDVEKFGMILYTEKNKTYHQHTRGK